MCSEIRVLLCYLDGVPHLLWPKVLLLDPPRSTMGGIRLKLHLLPDVLSSVLFYFSVLPIENSLSFERRNKRVKAKWTTHKIICVFFTKYFSENIKRQFILLLSYVLSYRRKTFLFDVLVFMRHKQNSVHHPLADLIKIK